MRIEIEYGETANAGNFESIRVACRIEEEFTVNNEEDLKHWQNNLYVKAKKFVQSKIIKELKARDA